MTILSMVVHIFLNSFLHFFSFISQAGRLADLDRLISEQIHFIEKVRNMVNVVFCIILFEKIS